MHVAKLMVDKHVANVNILMYILQGPKTQRDGCRLYTWQTKTQRYPPNNILFRFLLSLCKRVPNYVIRLIHFILPTLQSIHGIYNHNSPGILTYSRLQFYLYLLALNPSLETFIVRNILECICKHSFSYVCKRMHML